MARFVLTGEGSDSWNTLMLLYNSALKEMSTKVEILNDEFKHVHNYNPIEYVKTRIKSPDSILQKLKRYGYEPTNENMWEYCNDVAGIRIVCSFTADIFRLVDMICRQNDLTVLAEKDYINHPKESGYKSYHILVSVPIFLSDRVVQTKVEVQIRTIAMDFWASLEHKIYYKFEGNAPAYISRDLQECSEIVSMLDAKMLQLNEAVLRAKEQDRHRKPQMAPDPEEAEEIAKVASRKDGQAMPETLVSSQGQEEENVPLHTPSGSHWSQTMQG